MGHRLGDGRGRQPGPLDPGPARLGQRRFVVVEAGQGHTAPPAGRHRRLRGLNMQPDAIKVDLKKKIKRNKKSLYFCSFVAILFLKSCLDANVYIDCCPLISVNLACLYNMLKSYMVDVFILVFWP